MEKTFYIEYFLCNPALAQPERVIVWNDPEGCKAGKRPPHGRAPRLKGRGLHLPLGVAVLQ